MKHECTKSTDLEGYLSRYQFTLLQQIIQNCSYTISLWDCKYHIVYTLTHSSMQRTSQPIYVYVNVQTCGFSRSFTATYPRHPGSGQNESDRGRHRAPAATPVEELLDPSVSPLWSSRLQLTVERVCFLKWKKKEEIYLLRDDMCCMRLQTSHFIAAELRINFLLM